MGSNTSVNTANTQHHYEIIEQSGQISVHYWNAANPTHVLVPKTVVDTLPPDAYACLYLETKLRKAYGLRLNLLHDESLWVVFDQSTGIACDQDLNFVMRDTGRFQLKLGAHAAPFVVAEVVNGTLTQGTTQITSFPHTVAAQTEVVFETKDQTTASSMRVSRSQIPLSVTKLFGDPLMESAGYVYVFVGGPNFGANTELIVSPLAGEGQTVSVPFIVVDDTLKKVFDDPTFTVKTGRTGGG